MTDQKFDPYAKLRDENLSLKQDIVILQKQAAEKQEELTRIIDAYAKKDNEYLSRGVVNFNADAIASLQQLSKAQQEEISKNDDVLDAFRKELRDACSDVKIARNKAEHWENSFKKCDTQLRNLERAVALKFLGYDHMEVVDNG